MFAIDHAATALIIKRRFPHQPMIWLLLSVQFMELLWVALNYLGVERTSTEATVASVSDIHLVQMPFSHSVASMVVVAVAAWLLCRVAFGRPMLGLAVAIGILSHLVLDLVTHAADLPIAPGLESTKLGLGLYASLPMGAFVLELGYGVFCWWIYRGGRALLAVIIAFNVADLSLLSPSVPGPESLMANRPMLIVSVILVQIVVTLYLVGRFSARPAPARPAPGPAPRSSG